MSDEIKRNIHEGHRERMRNRYDNDPDFKSFSDHEILEFVLSLVIPRKDTNVLAHELIDKFGALDGVLTASVSELKRVKNMTVSASYLLSSMFPVLRRALVSFGPETRRSNKQLTTPSEMVEFIQPYFIGRKTECYALLLLDVNFRTIKTIFKAGDYGSELNIEASDLFLPAAREGARYVIIAHNHPSANVQPSLDDIHNTRILFEILDGMGITLVDHVIFYEYNMFSFRNNGMLAQFSDELDAKYRNTLKDDPAVRKSYLYDLNEYMVEPLTALSDERVKRYNESLGVVPKDEALQSFNRNRLRTQLMEMFYAEDIKAHDNEKAHPARRPTEFADNKRPKTENDDFVDKPLPPKK